MFKITQIACKFVRSPRVFYPIIAQSALKSFVTQKVRLYNNNKGHRWSPNPKIKFGNFNVAFALSILSWLGFDQDDEEKESELIMTLKRAVLCTQREEYDKAEQMLHLALRMAQQQQNKQGILYCYDLMANLAFDTYELDKAEKLFVNVLQLLLGKGVPQNDLKVIHISLKLARICQLKSNTERADMGYRWCLEQIESYRRQNEDAKVLYGVINDWYAQYLLDIGDMTKALVHLSEAYNVCTEIMGEQSEKVVLLLNDLGITSFRAEDYDAAEKFLKEAITLGQKLDDKSHLGVIHANLGLILLQKGIFREAEKFCVQGKKLGRKYDNPESIEQSNYCLDQIKLNKEEQAKKA